MTRGTSNLTFKNKVFWSSYNQLDNGTIRQMYSMIWACVCRDNTHVDELMHVRRHTVVTANLLSKVTLLFSVRSKRKETERRGQSNNSYVKVKEHGQSGTWITKQVQPSQASVIQLVGIVIQLVYKVVCDAFYFNMNAVFFVIKGSFLNCYYIFLDGLFIDFDLIHWTELRSSYD